MSDVLFKKVVKTLFNEIKNKKQKLSDDDLENIKQIFLSRGGSIDLIKSGDAETYELLDEIINESTFGIESKKGKVIKMDPRRIVAKFLRKSEKSRVIRRGIPIDIVKQNVSDPRHWVVSFKVNGRTILSFPRDEVISFCPVEYQPDFDAIYWGKDYVANGRLDNSLRYFSKGWFSEDTLPEIS